MHRPHRHNTTRNNNNNNASKLSEYDQNALLKEFPHIELSYETIIHKTVHHNTDNPHIILAIPEGPKHFAWFTTFKEQNVCILLEISKNKQICSIEMTKVCFKNELSYGTILYGTVFRENGEMTSMHTQTKYFSSEDIFYYKGKNVSKYPFIEKLNLFKTIYSSEIKQVSYNSSITFFGLPVLSLSYSDILNSVKTLPYNIHSIVFRHAHNINSSVLTMTYNKDASATEPNTTINTRKETVFRVKADIQNDIYNLYVIPTYNSVQLAQQPSENIYATAYIPDYKTSVMMNGLFRNIKENINLDALEESDDEDEFENDNVDKFVDLTKSYDMICAYNFKHKKWTPIRLAIST